MTKYAAEPESTLATEAASAAGEDKRRRLIASLRGYFLSPVIATLGELGLADTMLVGSFSVADFPDADAQTLATLFRYLHGVGLLASSGPDNYALTEEGRTTFSRNGAFSLLVSYAEYFDQLPALLAGEPVYPKVNRPRNVRGSGQLHGKKFFPEALNALAAEPPTAILDIGCGDGCFLEHVLERWPDITPGGLDLSHAALNLAAYRLRPRTSDGLFTHAANARDVEQWSAAIPAAIRQSPGLVLSLWFVAHEFSQSSPDVLTRFFTELHSAFPQARILLGEITHLGAEELAEGRDLSIMPEFLLFHSLSGQGVLSWQSWQSILDQVPYTLQHETLFDTLPSGAPASFLWLLKPKGRD